MTEIVSWPFLIRSSENFMASTGGMIRTSTPLVSLSLRQLSTRAMICASWARFLSSQKTAGAPVARARRSASCTQSLSATSWVSQARKMSPVATFCSRSTSSDEVTIRIVPFPGAMKVLSCEPYSSALRAMSPTFGTLPMVAGL